MFWNAPDISIKLQLGNIIQQIITINQNAKIDIKILMQWRRLAPLWANYHKNDLC